MSVLTKPVLVAALLCAAISVSADEPESNPAEAAATEILNQLEAQVGERLNDPEFWSKYDEAALQTMSQFSLRKDLDAVLAVAARIERFVDENLPDDESARKTAEVVRGHCQTYRWIVKAKRTTLDALRQHLTQDPNAHETVCVYLVKMQLEYQSMILADPESVGVRLQEEQLFVDGLRAQASDLEVRKIIEEIDQNFVSLEQRLDVSLNRLRLVGQAAPPLTDAQLWINGDPLTADDLQGKVVLLDFWAVFCVPCIAAFPDLRDWHAKYADRGLVTIGVTDRYGYVWDEASSTVKRSDGDVSIEEEGRMLQAFARKHELPFRLVLQGEGGLSSAFHVQTIPQVVLIDRQGRVRMIRQGHNEDISQDIEAMIEMLISE